MAVQKRLGRNGFGLEAKERPAEERFQPPLSEKLAVLSVLAWLTRPKCTPALYGLPLSVS